MLFITDASISCNNLYCLHFKSYPLYRTVKQLQGIFFLREINHCMVISSTEFVTFHRIWGCKVRSGGKSRCWTFCFLDIPIWVRVIPASNLALWQVCLILHLCNYYLLHCFCVVLSHAHVLTKELADATFADGAEVVMDTAKYVSLVNLLSL